MKSVLTLLMAIAATAHAQFAVMHTNGVVTSPANLTIQQSNVAGLAAALNGKLGTNPTLAISNTSGLQALLDTKLSVATNGQVEWPNTNTLTFTNPIRLSGNVTNNQPRLLWKTADGVGDGGIIVQSRGSLTNIWDSPTNAHTNWSILWIGQNIALADGQTTLARDKTNTGAAYLSIENAYNYDGNPADPSSEIYFTVIGNQGGTAERPLTIRTAYTNPVIGEIGLWHHVFIAPKELIDPDVLTINFSNSSIGTKNHLHLVNADTNNSRDIRAKITLGTNAMVFSLESAKAFLLMNLRGAIHYPFLFYTNGVVVGATSPISASARVHLAGDTRIDGFITFNNTTNAATTRTNLGLGNGITTNVSSGTLQFSNGILVGHTP